jgi:hypothetical protein
VITPDGDDAVQGNEYLIARASQKLFVWRSGDNLEYSHNSAPLDLP